MMVLAFVTVTAQTTVSLDAVVDRLALLNESYVVALQDASTFPPETLALSKPKLFKKLEGLGYRIEGNLLIPKAWPGSVFTERPLPAVRAKEITLEDLAPFDKSKLPLKEFFFSTIKLSKSQTLKFHSFYAPFELVVGGKPTTGAEFIGAVLKLIGSKKLSDGKTVIANPEPKIWQPRMLESINRSEGSPLKTFFQILIPELSLAEIDQLLSNMDRGKRFSIAGKPRTYRYVNRALDYFMNGPSESTGISDFQKTDLRERVDFKKIEVGMRANFTTGGVWFGAKPGGAQLLWLPIEVPSGWGNP
jgi:hypothetical protein